jgi:hypothetical protein
MNINYNTSSNSFPEERQQDTELIAIFKVLQVQPKTSYGVVTETGIDHPFVYEYLIRLLATDHVKIDRIGSCQFSKLDIPFYTANLRVISKMTTSR